MRDLGFTIILHPKIIRDITDILHCVRHRYPHPMLTCVMFVGIQYMQPGPTTTAGALSFASALSTEGAVNGAQKPTGEAAGGKGPTTSPGCHVPAWQT